MTERGMRCNLCPGDKPFTLPSPDPVTVELMKAHLWEKHGIERFKPATRYPVWDPKARLRVHYDDEP